MRAALKKDERWELPLFPTDQKLSIMGCGPLGKEALNSRVNRKRRREREFRHTSGCLLGLLHPLTDFLSIGDLVASQSCECVHLFSSLPP